jgi:hypothetical protein
MVQLSFRVLIQKDLDTVWEYFSEFTNIVKWDPNTKGCVALKTLPQRVGSEYNVTTLFNGNESEVKYVTRELRKNASEGYISLWG